MRRMKRFLLSILASLLCLAHVQAQVKVASLHPLLSEMARRIGGAQVEVVNLFPENGELHAFQPTAGDIARAAGAKIILACGKNLEPYMKDLQQSISEGTTIISLGNAIPDVYLPGSRRTDPHWWSTPNNMKRASRAMLRVLSPLVPQAKEAMAKQQREYAKEMDTLTREARLVFSRIPQDKRILTTSHAATAHFCKEFGFAAIAIHGIAHESEGDTASMAHLLKELRSQRVGCLFYDINESPRAMQTLAEQIGAGIRPIILDGIAPGHDSYASMFRENVKNIAAGLSAQN